MSEYILPFIVLIVVTYGLIKKIDIFDVFVEGATEALPLTLKIFPCLLAMLVAVNIFLESKIVENIFNFIKFIPTTIIPMFIMRPISGTSSLAILVQIYETIGPDGYLGTLASLIQGSTDTTLYIITLYFGSIGIKKIRYSLFVGLFTDIIAIITAIIVCNVIF